MEKRRKSSHTQLLLLEDVDDLGRSGDLVRVRPGFARNFLVPQGKALVADRNALRIRERLAAERAERAAHDRQAAELIASRVQGMTLLTEVKVDPEGHMYGSVGAAEIVHLFADQGVEIERKNVVLLHPIKALGTHDLTLKLKEGVVCNYRLKVKGEGVEEAVVETEEVVEE